MSLETRHGGTNATFISLWRQQSEDVVQPEPHHRRAGLQVSAVDLDDGRDAGKMENNIRGNKCKNSLRIRGLYCAVQ